MKLFLNWTIDLGNQFLTRFVTSIVAKETKCCCTFIERLIPCIPGQSSMSLQCDISRYQRLEQLALDFSDQGLLFVVLQADWHSLTSEWLAALWSSASQLFGPGLLHNYIKAWSTAQPQHTSYKYGDTSSLHSSPHCTLFSSSLSLFLVQHAWGSTGPIPRGDLCHCSQCHTLCKDACQWFWVDLNVAALFILKVDPLLGSPCPYMQVHGDELSGLVVCVKMLYKQVDINVQIKLLIRA